MKEKGESYQFRQWRQWHRVLAAEALAGPRGALVREVFEILRTMHLRDARISSSCAARIGARSITGRAR
jgi:hypothetical protein